MGLVSHWFSRSNRGRAAGIMLSGNGIAIVLTGLLIPWVNAASGDEGWRTGWLIIGIISLLIALVAAFFLRNEPGEKGLEPLGDGGPRPQSSLRESGKKKDSNKWTIVHLGAIYFFFRRHLCGLRHIHRDLPDQ